MFRERVQEWMAAKWAEGHAEGQAEGQTQGQMDLMRRQAARKFGDEIAERLAERLEPVQDAARLAEIGRVAHRVRERRGLACTPRPSVWFRAGRTEARKPAVPIGLRIPLPRRPASDWKTARAEHESPRSLAPIAAGWS